MQKRKPSYIVDTQMTVEAQLASTVFGVQGATYFNRCYTCFTYRPLYFMIDIGDDKEES